MIVSAISGSYSPVVGVQKVSYDKTRDSRRNEFYTDTTFNSLAPYKKINSTSEMSKVFDSINEWKGFCHKQIVGEKLNVIA